MRKIILMTEDGKNKIQATVESVSELKQTFYGAKYFSIDVTMAIQEKDLKKLNLEG